jgi:hypothetical protein
MSGVGKIRNPKSEIRKKAETRSPKARDTRSLGQREIRACGTSMITGPFFGFRISGFFRPSDFGLRPYLTFLIFVSTSVVASSAETNVLPDLPSSSLKPPRGEILPSFWEQYGTWIVLGSVVALAAIGVVIWLASRPKPSTPIPWAVQARQELDSLRHQPEDGFLLSRTAQIVRHYVAMAFGLPAGELNTSEFCGTVEGCEKIGPELAHEIIDYLHASDLRKFAPGPKETPLGALARAERIIERTESRLADLSRVAFTPSTDLDSPRPPKTAREQKLASGA